ncbi:flavin reductase family protein [Streptomyces sp. NPDC056653]|uniref:flavin reductase family protein n=1 Tax=Streptomyces sp. NPDC056653 TaxID=3345894 RepID=UPI00369551DC
MITVDSNPEREAALRQAFACFPSGVTAMCALFDNEPVGMAVSSFTSVSMEPPLLSVCVQNTSGTWPKLRERPRLGLSVLAEDQAAAGRRLAMKTGDRFADLALHPTTDGALFVLGAAAWFDCSIQAEVPAGDHVVVLLEVHGLQAEPDVAPLVFHGSRFRRLDARELVAEAS